MDTNSASTERDKREQARWAEIAEELGYDDAPVREDAGRRAPREHERQTRS